jgi:hypothetical protein
MCENGMGKKKRRLDRNRNAELTFRQIVLLVIMSESKRGS